MVILDAARTAFIGAGFTWESFHRLTPFATIRHVRGARERGIHQAWHSAAFSRTEKLAPLENYVGLVPKEPPQDVTRMVMAMGVTADELERLGY